MPKPLTARQQAIYDFIADAIRSGGPPTIREIMDVFGINSTNGVRTTLETLEKKATSAAERVAPGHRARRFRQARLPFR